MPTPSALNAVRRNNHFNLLRLFFAAMVILSHSTALIDGDTRRDPLIKIFHASITFGEFAVDGFFLLSGYLITMSWDRDPVAKDYLIKRVLRIYPGYLVAALLSALVFPLIVVKAGPYFEHFDIKRLVASLATLKEPSTPQAYPPPFATPNGSMWTIGYEFRCYLMVAGFGMVVGLRNRKIWLATTVAFAVAALLPESAFRGWPGHLGYLSDLIKSMRRLVSAFFVGGSFYLFRDHVRYSYVGSILSTAVLLLLGFAPLAQSAVLTAVPYLLFAFAFARVPWLDRFRELPDISYGLYLYGWPVQKCLIVTWPGISPFLLFIIATAIAGLLGLASWHLVEAPFLRLKPHPTVLADPPAVTPVPI